MEFNLGNHRSYRAAYRFAVYLYVLNIISHAEWLNVDDELDLAHVKGISSPEERIYKGTVF